MLITRLAVVCCVLVAACSDQGWTSAPEKIRLDDVAIGSVPAMGWNSFDVLSSTRAGYGQTWLNESHIEGASDALARIQSAGYTYINIDSGWSSNLAWTSNTIDGFGVPQPDPVRFPDGISAVANYVYAKGQKLGVYETVGLPGEIYNGNYPIAGTSCHVQDIVKQPMTIVPNGWGAEWEIDFTNPCAQAYYNSIANEFAAWGVDLLKVDGTTADNGPDIEAWQKALAQTGRAMWLTVSAWPVPLALAPQIRDAGQGVRIDTDVDCYCSTISSWTASVDQRWSDLPNWLAYLGPGHFADLDSMPINNTTGAGVQDGLSDVERQSVMSFWSLASAPLWIGGDIYFMDTTAQAILSNPEVIAVDQAAVLPAQIASGNSQVWKKAMPDGTIVVGVFNLGGSSASISVDFGALGIGGDASIRDLVARSELGTFTDNWTASNVPSHGSRLVKLTSESADGIAGYTFCSGEYQSCMLSGTMDVAYGAEGSYVFKSGLSGTIACGNGTFGSDPAYGSTKGCYARAHGGGGPASFVFCAGENGTCPSSGVVDVAYGAVGSFAYQTSVVGSIACNNSTFGDPAYGWSKACYTRPQGGGVAYEAEGATLSGSAIVGACSNCSGGKKVGYLGNGGRVTFAQVDVAATGSHALFIHGVSADPRSFEVSVNGGAPVSVNVQSGDWSTPASARLDVQLQRGINTIALYNDATWAPDLDRIVVW